MDTVHTDCTASHSNVLSSRRVIVSGWSPPTSGVLTTISEEDDGPRRAVSPSSSMDEGPPRGVTAALSPRMETFARRRACPRGGARSAPGGHPARVLFSDDPSRFLAPTWRPAKFAREKLVLVVARCIRIRRARRLPKSQLFSREPLSRWACLKTDHVALARVSIARGDARAATRGCSSAARRRMTRTTGRCRAFRDTSSRRYARVGRSSPRPPRRRTTAGRVGRCARRRDSPPRPTSRIAPSARWTSTARCARRRDAKIPRPDAPLGPTARRPPSPRPTRVATAPSDPTGTARSTTKRRPAASSTSDARYSATNSAPLADASTRVARVSPSRASFPRPSTRAKGVFLANDWRLRAERRRVEARLRALETHAWYGRMLKMEGCAMGETRGVPADVPGGFGGGAGGSLFRGFDDGDANAEEIAAAAEARAAAERGDAFDARAFRKMRARRTSEDRRKAERVLRFLSIETRGGRGT